MTPIKFKAEHIAELQPIQSAQAQEFEFHDGQLENFILMEKHGQCYTILDREEKPVVCGGIMRIWEGRAFSWYHCTEGWHRRISVKAFRDFSLDCLRRYPAHRIEATVSVDFEKGKSWLKKLGFVEEAACLKHYGGYGLDMALYAKFKT